MKKFKIINFSGNEILKVIEASDRVEAGEIAEDLFGYSVRIENI